VLGDLLFLGRSLSLGCALVVFGCALVFGCGFIFAGHDRLLSLDFVAAGLEHAHGVVLRLARLLLVVGKHLEAHAIGLAGLGVEDRHVGLVDRQRLVDHAAGGALQRVG